MEKITSNDNHNLKEIEIIVKQYNREKRNNNNHNKSFNNRRNDKKSNWSSNENNINSQKNDLQSQKHGKERNLDLNKRLSSKKGWKYLLFKVTSTKGTHRF